MSASLLHRTKLAAPDDFAGWREAVRCYLAAGVAPEQIIWEVAGNDMPDLFGEDGEPPTQPSPQANVTISRDFLEILRLALLHSAPNRFALAYRIVWRMRTQPNLPRDPADPDVIAIRNLAKAVRRDLHKMHAFVRFRKVGDTGGRECYAAWFEPDHHIVRAVAGFFRDRFTGMNWLIVTPQASISWDGAMLREGEGGTADDVPAEDAVEAEWLAYYSSIFNPARLKVKAMKKEMPVRYWRNLPESALISTLIRDASRRVEAMVSEKNQPDLFGSAEAAPEVAPPQFETLDALYAALIRDDVPPSPNFSDRIVAGEGPRHAPLMFVGEQPGDQEDVAGQVFVGPAGQLLDACLEEAGVDRAQCFLTNAVKRFKFEQRGKRRLHQTPTAGDVAHYRWWLNEEIRLVAPRLVVALGATALHGLTGKKQALAPLRGSIMPWNDRQLLVTVHPSFLLRLPDEQARVIERGKFVRELAKAQAA